MITPPVAAGLTVIGIPVASDTATPEIPTCTDVLKEDGATCSVSAATTPFAMGVWFKPKTRQF